MVFSVFDHDSQGQILLVQNIYFQSSHVTLFPAEALGESSTTRDLDYLLGQLCRLFLG